MIHIIMGHGVLRCFGTMLAPIFSCFFLVVRHISPRNTC